MTLLWVVLGVGLLLSVVNPGLLVWLAFGLLLPFTPDIVRHAWRWRKVVLLCAGLTLVVASFLFPFSSGDIAPLALPRVVAEVSYTGNANLQEDPDRLALDETISIDRATVDSAASAAATRPDIYGRGRPGLSPRSDFEPGDPRSNLEPEGSRGDLRSDFRRQLEREIVEGMAAAGWRMAPPSTAGLEFTRTRNHEIKLPTIKAEDAATLEPPHPLFKPSSSDYLLDLPLDKTSTLAVTAEKGAIGGTFPESKTQAKQVDRDTETTVLPMPKAREKWELRVRRNLFREEPFVRIAELTFSKAAVGLVALLVALTVAAAKDSLGAFLTRQLERLLRSPHDEPA